MIQSLKKIWRWNTQPLSRRAMLHRWSLLPLSGLSLTQTTPLLTAAKGLRLGKDIYSSIGVRPLINARGTFTIISGSLMLPEVRAAMDAAAQRYVHLDELMEAIGARLAELTKAEWGMVTSGCAAALTHATAACVAGGNPDLHVRIPNLQGFPKDEVIIPRHSRNVYDAAVRAVGVRILEVESIDDLLSALGPRTAMIYILAGPQADKSPLSTQAIAQIVGPKGVPILVDAAAEILTVPNVHLESGASLVGYSGGKCIRGPQSAGLLLGRKDLVRAAWIHSAPHHGFARSMKVGKEEAIGMLMAVEMWAQRDHPAEWNRWLSWLEHCRQRLSVIAGVTATIEAPAGLSNRTPALAVRWDPSQLGINGRSVVKHLWETEPRIAMSAWRGEKGKQTGVSITPYMMVAGEEVIVADRLYALLSTPPKQETAGTLQTPAFDLSGRWDVRIDFTAGSSRHSFHIQQEDHRLEGTHQGDFVSRDLTGSIEGDTVQMTSSYTERHGDSLLFTFSGKVAGSDMAGTLDMGEYLTAQWKATKHEYRKD